jgi:hypothetical protein
MANAIRNQVQQQREVGYMFAGSQPSLMQEMLSSKRPFYKAGPQMFLDKIPAEAWEEFITFQFRRRGRTIDEEAVAALLATADLIPYDVQRIAHELWDYAEIADKRILSTADVKRVINKLVIGQSTYYELLWEQLPARQRATLQALAHRELRRSIPRLSAASFASARRQVFRRRSSLWMRAILSTVTEESISFWILCSSAGSDPKSHSLYAVQRYARRHNCLRSSLRTEKFCADITQRRSRSKVHTYFARVSFGQTKLRKPSHDRDNLSNNFRILVKSVLCEAMKVPAVGMNHQQAFFNRATAGQVNSFCTAVVATIASTQNEKVFFGGG